MSFFESTWKRRLMHLVSEMQSRGYNTEYPLNTILEIVKAPRKEPLILELTRLIAEGKLAASYRVRSPSTHAGLGDFKDLEEIPDTMYDDTSDSYIHPKLGRDIELIYRNLR